MPTQYRHTQGSVMYLWKKCSLPERIWVIFFIVLFLLLYFFGSITLLTVATAIMGSICMFLGAKAKIANFLPGAVYTILYSWQCYLYNHEISLVLNLFFHFPMQFVGWYLWHTHRVHHPSMQEDILVRQLFPHGGIAVVMGLILVATLFAFVYLTIGIGAYKLDILVVVFYIAAQFLMVGRFVEAWYTWLCVNVFNISLWTYTAITIAPSYSLAFMWLIFMGNCAYATYRWTQIGKRQAALYAGPYCLLTNKPSFANLT